jgi:hypothetical protein
LSNTRKILTLHSPIGVDVVDELLTSIEGALHRVGAERVWIDPRSSHDLTVLAELPELTIDPSTYVGDELEAGIAIL